MPCWSEKDNKRPSFRTICRSIEEFRQGADTKTGYYAAADDDDDDDVRNSQPIYDDGR